MSFCAIYFITYLTHRNYLRRSNTHVLLLIRTNKKKPEAKETYKHQKHFLYSYSWIKYFQFEISHCLNEIWFYYFDLYRLNGFIASNLNKMRRTITFVFTFDKTHCHILNIGKKWWVLFIMLVFYSTAYLERKGKILERK